MSTILIVGSIALDTVTTPFGTAREVLGGAAVYASFAASIFSPVQVVGVVGSDFPEEHLRALEHRGIDTRGIAVVEGGESFRWEGYYEYDMSQAHTIRTELNVFEQFRPQIPKEYRQAEYVFLANIDPELQLSVLDQVESPTLTMADTMDYWIENKRDDLLRVLSRVDVALMNDAEARELTDTPNLSQGAQRILQMGPHCVAVKKGEHGALVCTREGHFIAASYPMADVRDPTGAGDSFAGGMIGFLAEAGDCSEPNIRRAIVCGSVMASYAIEDFSLGRLAQVTPDDVLARYNALRACVHFEELS